MTRFFDYRPEYERQRPEIDAAIRRVLDSGRLILGPEVEGLEREFAAYAGVSGAVGVNSGTDALTLALHALDVGPGDEVLTVANAGVPPVAAIRAVGALPRFVDIRPDTLQMDVDAIEPALTPRTRCVVPVHLYGAAAPLTPILELAGARGLAVVEDCAQAHGTRYAGRHVGSFGAVGCFSFYPTKNLGALGDGGLCVTDDPALETKIRAQRMYGFDARRHARMEGRNSRLDELQAAILRVKLGRLDESLAERAALAEVYRRRLQGSSYELPGTSRDGTHAYHLFVVLPPRREPVAAALESRGIGYGVHYEEPVHLMEAYRFLGYTEGMLPVTEAACRRVLSLPLYPGLPEEEAERVADVLLNVG